MAARGGVTEVLTRPDTNDGEQDHLFPSLLPGGRGVLFTIVEGGSQRGVAVLDLNTGKWKTVIRSGSQAVYAETGHLVYEDGGALWAVRFDAATQDSVGDPVPVVERVTWRNASANFAFSRHGMLVYTPWAGAARPVRWCGWTGAATRPQSRRPRARISYPAYLPTGPAWRSASLTATARSMDLGFSLQKLSPLQTGPVGAFLVWSRDSRHLIFGAQHLFRRAADGTGAVEQLTTSDVIPKPPSAAPWRSRQMAGA